MVVGFTGTRKGMTQDQWRVVKDLVSELRPFKVVHGDCMGADADFHVICQQMLREDVEIVLRPGCNARGESPTRAHCHGASFTHPTKQYLVRDEEIVKDADVLIACPSGTREMRRSGTWATIRKARKHQVVQYIVGPNGVLI